LTIKKNGETYEYILTVSKTAMARVKKQYSDDEYEERKLKYTHNQPYDKESLYYREVFEMYYPHRAHTIPYFWKQPFVTEKDPSAWLVESKTVE
jgi:hypothetical protein